MLKIQRTSGIGVGPLIIMLAFFCCSVNSCQERKQDDTNTTHALNVRLFKAPDFSLKTTFEERFYLNKYINNSYVVVVHFWNTGCLPCHKEMLYLNSKWSEFKQKKIMVVGVGTDPENSSAIMKIQKHLNISYPLVLDSGQLVMKRYGVDIIPTTFIIDKDGYVVWRRVGYEKITEREIDDLLIKLTK